MRTNAPEVRRTVIEGRTVLVDDRPRPLPPTLALLLEGGRGPDGRRWSALRVAVRTPLAIGGATAECLLNDHRMRGWLEGFFLGSDGVSRFLSLQACADCGAVCVRDRSFDSLDRYSGERADLRSAGRRPLRRRDEVIGWYSGARPRGRVYT